MEDPATRGRAERIVAEVLASARENASRPPGQRRYGLSVPRQITDALREAGFDLTDEEDADGHKRAGTPPPPAYGG